MKYPVSPSAARPAHLPSPFLRRACRLLLRSFVTISHLDPLFSIVCSLFSENTRVGGTFPPPSAFPTFQTFELSHLQTQFCPRLFSTSYKSLSIPHRHKNHLFLIHLQIPFCATPLFSHPYKSPGGVGSPSVLGALSGSVASLFQKGGRCVRLWRSRRVSSPRSSRSAYVTNSPATFLRQVMSKSVLSSGLATRAASAAASAMTS